MKGIDLFTKNFSIFKDLNEFISSPVYNYITKVYGDLFFDSNSNSGILKVNRLKNGDIIVSESCYYDYEIDGCVLGYFYPKKNHKESCLKIINSHQLKNISKIGFITNYNQFSNEIRNTIIKSDFEDHSPEKDLEAIEESHNLNQKIYTERNEYKENYSFLKVKDEDNFYYSNGYKIPNNLLKWSKLNKKILKKLLRSPWISSLINNDISIQKMVSGNEVPRHTDTLPNGTDRHLIYSIYWIVEAPFIGRELVIGKRTENDLKKYILSCLGSQDNTTGYCSVPFEFEDTLKIKPEDGKGIYLNAFNPIFYHGVEKMIIGDSVYTISDHFKLK